MNVNSILVAPENSHSLWIVLRLDLESRTMVLAVNFCGPLAFECSEDAEHRLRAALLPASGDAVRAFQRLK